MTNSTIPREREIFCNRTLNLRSIRAIGYDMDYTLIHYHVEEWEKRAYSYLKEEFVREGWPVKHLEFDSTRVCRGLIIDTEQGNLIKTNRFGFVKHAMHGTKVMDFETQRKKYLRTIIDLNEKHYKFLNTLFSLSEGCMYAQLVDLLDEDRVPKVKGEAMGYVDLYDKVKKTLDAAHMEGRLKAEIIANPDRFVVLDAEAPLALLDQYYAGKKLMLITNSDWGYTKAMMAYAFDGFLPKDLNWRKLFEYVVVSARKPDFFTTTSPFFEIVTEDGLLKPVMSSLKKNTPYLGGSARELEAHLGLSGDEILYVGDHMFGDVHVTKNVLRWRTALVLRELEDEIKAISSFQPTEKRLASLMDEKEKLEYQLCQTRVQIQKDKSRIHLQKMSDELFSKIKVLDQGIIPLVKSADELSNSLWGLLMRAGNDKSHLAFQMERYADIYTSRVSNFLYATPYAYLRSPRGSLPHDP